MNILEIKKTMIEKGIPAEVIDKFTFPVNEDETPEEKVAFAKQMDKFLTREQIITVMEEQGCSKTEPSAEFMLKLKDKSIEERIEIINSMDISKTAHCRLNEDGTLSVFWDFDEDGKYRCVCPIIDNLPKPISVTKTYCGCCSGHVKYHFEKNLAVKLRLLETVSSPISSSGEKYCEHLFAII